LEEGVRQVGHDAKELVENVGKNDPCPCGLGKKVPPLLPPVRSVLTA
jgi:uncharacterized protein YecA (UPF0149 family)